MKKTITIICAAVALCSQIICSNAAEPFQPLTKLRPNKTVLLYPEGQNVDKGIAENGKMITLGPGESNGLTGEETMPENGNIGSINDNARIDIYIPKRPNGQMIVVCPGGGYGIVSSFNEGAYVADWCVKQGISVCVVKYRLPDGHWTVPLTDVQNAFRYCRAHAEEWGIRQIGVMGFSAGGHLAASASTLFVDDVTRPDFSILIYPVITMDLALTHRGTHDSLIGKERKWLDKNLTVNEYEKSKAEYDALMEHYSLEKQVTEKTPATMLLLSADDKTVPPENSFMYYDSLKANGVQAQMYVFPYGGHGWGFTTVEFGGDRLGAYRPVFFQAIKAWMGELLQTMNCSTK